MPANIKDIDKRIRSVRNTQQITKAMKMVAAAKLRRAQERLLAGRPYGAKLRELLEGLSGALVDHPFYQERPLRKRLVVVVSSDKGLCGSYNANILREVHRWLEQDHGEVTNELYVVGRKAGAYFRRRDWPVRKVIDDLGGTIDHGRFSRIALELMDLFLKDEVQEITLFYTRFISTLSHHAERMVLLPLPREEDEEGKGAGRMEYLYEPDGKIVLQQLLPQSVRNMVASALSEAFTSEHGARMTSMGAATDNAAELIDKLVLFRNRARQAAITQEISEIVGGADALS